MNQSKPKVSIIVPIYNVEKYLRECLDSLINQTLKDIEIICLNGGSTDNSSKILEEYGAKDKRIKVINKENKGYGHSMNMGLDVASADYIGVLESDDFAEPEMFEDLYNLITKNDCDVAKSNYWLYYSKGKNGKDFSNIISKNLTGQVINAKTNPDIMFFVPSIWTALYKKDFIKKNNIKFLETPGASYQDTSFTHKVMMCAKRVILTDKAYVYYRQNNSNSSVKNKSKVYCIIDEYNEVYSYINSHPELEVFRQYMYAIQFFGYSWNLNRIDKVYKKDFFNIFYDEFKSYYDNNLLSTEFFDKIKNFANFDTFINSPQKYLQEVIKIENKLKQKRIRRNIIQIRINKEEISLKLFGKKLLDFRH